MQNGQSRVISAPRDPKEPPIHVRLPEARVCPAFGHPEGGSGPVLRRGGEALFCRAQGGRADRGSGHAGGRGRPVQGQERLGAGHRGAVRARRVASHHRRGRQGARPQGAGFRQARRGGHGQDSGLGERRDHPRRSAGRRHQAGSSSRYRARRGAARLQLRALQDQAQGQRGQARRGQGHDRSRGRRCRGEGLRPARRGGEGRDDRARPCQ